MANLKENRQKIKEEFTYFLSKVVKSSRYSKESGDSLGESSISSYLLFIEPKRLFDYNPEAWKSIVSMYDITDPIVVDDIQKKLFQDTAFLKHDKSDNSAFRSNALSHYKHFLYARDYFKKIADEDKKEDIQCPQEFGDFTPRQIIYYGAPGTGKSHTIKKEEDEGKITCIRTTFHPDSDYATFVGCYKPHKIEGTKDLTYEFVEQAFLEAYKQAWMNPKEEIALVIEEINRGNCAQVFGDIFQLLDRSDDGWSTYPIKADTDIAEHLKGLHIPGYAATMKLRFGLDKEGNDRYPDRDWFGFMALPPNMSILATMNTSDQSLFPIDSAFKRRWDWKYIKIKKGKDKNGKELGWNIQIEDANGEPVKIIKEETKLPWWNFIQKVNEIIASMTSSADKQLGYFFCKPSKKANETDEKPTIITADTLVGKVIFYLWNDVFKDYGFEDASLFTYQEEKDGKKMDKDLAFADFYDEEGELVNTERLVDFLKKIMKWQNNNTENE